MRTFILGVLLASVVWVFLTLNGSTRLRQIWDHYRDARLIEKAQALAQEREDAFAKAFRPDIPCLAPASELKKLECQNRQAMARESFYADWNRANAGRFPQ